jgi:hypothetical protein
MARSERQRPLFLVENGEPEQHDRPIVPDHATENRRVIEAIKLKERKEQRESLPKVTQLDFRMTRKSDLLEFSVARAS